MTSIKVGGIVNLLLGELRQSTESSVKLRSSSAAAGANTKAKDTSHHPLMKA